VYGTCQCHGNRYGYDAELSVKAGQMLMTSSDPGIQAYHNRLLCVVQMSVSERTDASSCIIQDLDILLASVHIIFHNWITESVCMLSAKVSYRQSESLSYVTLSCI